MANMVNVLNTILSNASADYQARVPKATADNIVDVGSGIMSFTATQNEFLSALVNKIALVIVANKTYKNPLSVLKKGGLPFGRNIEEIFTNPATGEKFDPTGQNLLKRNDPDTKAIYHTLNRQDMYKVTVTKAQLMQAFTSYEKLNELLNSIVTSLYSGDNFDEFLLMKELFASGIEGGKIKTTEVEPVTNEETAKAFVKAIKTVGQAMTFASSTFNTYADINGKEGEKPVITWTPIENQILILRNDISVEVDVELLAKAFNVSYTDLKQRTLIVDSFGTNVNCGAVLCDESFVRVYDNLKQTEEYYNPAGLYTNYMLHHWQTYSLSIFANAMAFMFPTE